MVIMMNLVTLITITLSVALIVEGNLYAAFTPSLRCDTNNQTAPLPTPTYGTGGIFSICTEQIIRGSIQHIYTTLLDFRAYATWNSFVVDVQLPDTVTTASDVYLNMPMTFTTSGLISGVNTTSNEIVTVLSAPSPGNQYAHKAIAINAWRWDDGLGGLGRAEHPNLLTDLGDDTVRYISYETYYGVGGAPVYVLHTQLQEAFERQGKNLKDFIEGVY
ncbi:hypothetical protein EJ05DRAFT_501887 [Pseudovirgaria hyperparasitica]|uniref:Uncharacterized protein n=1 Tax=Pseudovirgaria hyperparasitica TaxID=470096 RepID=A0A6A6W5P7_9PEZI|nr:uncharacterized protein EJ05DRAFT_501887 [Pseudovirgaria hyperparasitica]KAF2756381.1 hypothetical protein EJ05DRAFT_501887 [Pseudovirgaria hyperparasitica]